MPNPQKSLNDSLLKDRNDTIDDPNRPDRSFGVEQGKDEIPTQQENQFPVENETQPYPVHNESAPCPDQTNKPPTRQSTPYQSEKTKHSPYSVDEVPPEAVIEMVDCLISAHSELHPGAEVSTLDMTRGFPNAAKALLGHPEVKRFWKFSSEGLANRFAKFIKEWAWDRNWEKPPHGGNYASPILIKKFVEQDEMIQMEKHMLNSGPRDYVGMSVD